MQAKGQDQLKIPDLETLLSKRDYQGAIAVLQFKRHANRNDARNLEWLAYCHFHFGEHDKVRHVHPCECHVCAATGVPWSPHAGTQAACR